MINFHIYKVIYGEYHRYVISELNLEEVTLKLKGRSVQNFMSYIGSSPVVSWVEDMLLVKIGASQYWIDTTRSDFTDLSWYMSHMKVSSVEELGQVCKILGVRMEKVQPVVMTSKQDIFLNEKYLLRFP